jgi:transposase
MAYSNDLRVRVIRVVGDGATARAAARQFVIGDSTAIRWAKRWRETGSFEACQCRFKFPQMCRSKIPQSAGLR